MSKPDVEAPDYTAVAEASRYAAELQEQLGRDQLEFSRDMYEQNAPMLQEIADTQMAAQQQQMDQAKDYYDYQVETFRPLEKGLVADAENFNTESYKDQMSAQAAADSGRAFGIARAQNERASASMGVNPNSGRFAGMNAASGLQQAASRANAMTGARNRAEQMGYARKLDATGLGRGLAGASTAAYGGATSAGSQAGMNAQSAGQTMVAGMGQAAGTIAAGQNMQIQGLSTVLNNQTQSYMNSQESMLGDIGGLLGGAASAYTAFSTPGASDRRLKENIEAVGVDQRTALTLYQFNYIGDDRRFQGVMADEVELSYPDAVVMMDNGYKAVKYDLLNIDFKEVH
jgi:hypothetical protein